MDLSIFQKIYYVVRTGIFAGFTCAWKLALALFLDRDVMLRPKGYKHPFGVRGNDSDPIVFFATFIKKEYALPYQDEIEVILDLGGNVGYSAIYFAKHYPQAKVIVLEPDERNYAALIANTRPYSNIIPRKSGVWWRKSRLKVSNPDAYSWEFQFEECRDGGIECVTIGELLGDCPKGTQIMVKMDIEGAEKEIFEKDPSWIADAAVIQLEIHGCWRSVFNALAAYDYAAFLSGENVVVDLKGRVNPPMPPGTA